MPRIVGRRRRAISLLMARLFVVVPLCVALGSAAALNAPGQSPVVARCQVDGTAAVVSRDDLAIELCLRFRGTEQGKTALKFLVDCELISSAAIDQKLMPGPAAIRAWIEKLEQRLQGAGVSLAELMAEKRMSRAEFEIFAKLQLAHEKLVRAALELDEDEPVKAQMLELWLREARVKQNVVVEPEKLPAGIVGQIGQRRLTELELGHALIRTSAVSRRHKFIRQIVLRRWLAALAKRHGIQVTAADMEREVEARRREAENDPKYQGVPFEQILRAQGSSLAAMRKSPVLLAQLQEQKLSEVLLSEEKMKQLLSEDRDQVLRRHGARRRLSVLLTRVKGEDEAAAHTASQQIHERIVREIPFAEAARTYSDDPYTKVAGGDTGWHNREGSRIPELLVEAAFAKDVGVGWVSEPLKTEYGYYLVSLVAIEPEPTEAMLMIRMRQAFVNEERLRMLKEARIQFFDA